MKRKVNLRFAIATTVFMMAMSLMSVNGQFLYRSSHLFLGPLPTYNDPSYVGTKPNFFIGPKFGIEYNYNSEGGLDFFIAWPEPNFGQSKLHIDDAGNVGVGKRPSTSGSYKLDVDGVVRTTSVVTTSDYRLKRNIKGKYSVRSTWRKSDS
ncbi:MAG: hypothetical protein LBL07_14810 [Tannerella sp.]|jgi:hypothetical protein|nr:hypothetical protein [Tannerella sp.]